MSAPVRPMTLTLARRYARTHRYGYFRVDPSGRPDPYGNTFSVSCPWCRTHLHGAWPYGQPGPRVGDLDAPLIAHLTSPDDDLCPALPTPPGRRTTRTSTGGGR